MIKILPSKRGSDDQKSFILDEIDIFSALEGDKGSCLFLGKYSLSEVSAVLKKRNFFKDAKKRGLWPLEYHLDTSESPLQRFRIYCEERKEENLIVDLKLREGFFKPKGKFIADISLSRFNFLFIEWLTLQNPLLEFSGDLTPLPGQKHPGLNLGKKVLTLFEYLARLCNLDGLLGFPAYFHNAILFSRHFYFLNPEKQGEVLGIRKIFRHIPFKQLAWIVYLDCLQEKDLGIYKWEAEEQVYPLNKKLKTFFESKSYKDKARMAMERLEFAIDWESFREKERQTFLLE